MDGTDASFETRIFVTDILSLKNFHLCASDHFIVEKAKKQ
jgi:hypothetical protein